MNLALATQRIPVTAAVLTFLSRFRPAVMHKIQIGIDPSGIQRLTPSFQNNSVPRGSTLHGLFFYRSACPLNNIIRIRQNYFPNQVFFTQRRQFDG